MENFVNWRLRYTKEERLSKYRKYKHTYDQHSEFTMFGNLFLDIHSEKVYDKTMKEEIIGL
jgi:hypothetical protein